MFSAARLIGGLGACVLLLCSPTTDARSRQASLTYVLAEGAGDCPSRHGLLAAVAERLGYQPFVDKAEEEVRVQLRAEGSFYSADIMLLGADGRPRAERTVAASVAGCDQMIDALALAISLALDPDAIGRVQRPRRAPEGPATRATRLAYEMHRGAPSLAPEAHVSQNAQGSWHAGARLAVTWGQTPSVSPLIEVTAEYHDAWWAVRAALGATLPMERDYEGDAYRGSRVSVSASGCGSVAWFQGCLFMSAGVLHLSGSGFVNARSVVLPCVGAGARAMVSLALSKRTSLAFHTEVEIPMIQAEARVADVLLWTSQPLGISAGLGLSWRL